MRSLVRFGTEGLFDERIGSVAASESDEVEFLSPCWSIVCVGVHAEDEDKDWEYAEDVYQGDKFKNIFFGILAPCNEPVTNCFE